jgi:predicted enzyme involved in methoxymalonyl-ACP biosynthesis
LTGAAIVELSPEKEKRWTVDTLLLSCRVLGRRVETAFMAAIAGAAREDGAEELFASFIPTPKNAPAASFLHDHGFVTAEGHSWRAAISAVPAVPDYINLITPPARSVPA